MSILIVIANLANWLFIPLIAFIFSYSFGICPLCRLLLKAPVKRRRICLFVKQMPEQKLIRGGRVQPGLHFSRFSSPVASKYHLWKEVGVFTQAARTQRAYEA